MKLFQCKVTLNTAKVVKFHYTYYAELCEKHHDQLIKNGQSVFQNYLPLNGTEKKA